MKYKKVLGVLFIILGILLLLTIIYCSLGKETKANIMFGNKECNKIEIMTDDFIKRRCKICLKEFNGSSSENICNICSAELNRCSVCGGKRTKIEIIIK